MNTPYALAQSPPPVGQLAVNPHAIPVELVQRESSPVSNYNIPKYGFVVPHEPNPGTSYGSSRSTEGPRTITPTTSAETQSSYPKGNFVHCSSPCSLDIGPLITELAWRSNSTRTDEEDGPETSVIQTTYPTPDGRRIAHDPKAHFGANYI